MNRWLGALGCALTLGCNGDGKVPLDAGDAGVDGCGPTLALKSGACVPVLDDCPESHVPVPGGGCKRVGVELCEVGGIPGIKGPPDWTCKRVGVVECEGGIRGPPDWTCTPIASGTCPGGLKIGSACEPIGPPRTSCLPGWAVTQKDGWCEPILPEQECSGATMAKIGHATCQPVGQCGSGTWGNIKTTAGTLFVDASSTGGDGSKAAPFSTIGDALAAVKEGGHIALAAGTYAESLVIDRAVTLEGRCAAGVELQGKGEAAGVTVKTRGVVLRGMSVTADHVGVELRDSGELRLEQVVVHDCGGPGVRAREGGQLTVQDSLVADNTGRGVDGLDVRLVLGRSQVRGTEMGADKDLLEAGVFLNGAATRPWIEVLDSVVSGNREVGLRLFGVQGAIRRSVARRSRVSRADGRINPAVPDGTTGYGLLVAPPLDETDPSALPAGLPSTLTLEDCLVADNRSVGLVVVDSTVTAQRTVVRDTREDENPGMGDAGVVVQRQSAPAKLVLRDSAVVRSGRFGVITLSGALTLERCVVSDTRPSESGESGNKEGFGVVAQSMAGQRPVLELSRALVERNHRAGVDAAGADVTLDLTVIRDTAPDAASGDWGAGVVLEPNPNDGQTVRATIRRSTIADNVGPSASVGAGLWAVNATIEVTDSALVGNRREGVRVQGGAGRLERVVVRDTLELESGYQGVGVDVLLHDPGSPAPPSLELRDSLVAGNHRGVNVGWADATIERTVIRDNTPTSASDGFRGTGLFCESQQNLPGRAQVLDSILLRNTLASVRQHGSEVTLERSVVSDTRPLPSGEHGCGVLALADQWGRASTLTVRDSLVTQSHEAGIELWDSTARVERSVVRDTLPAPSDGTLGPGILALSDKAPARLSLLDSELCRNRTAGLEVVGAVATVRRCRIRGSLPAKLLVNPSGTTTPQLWEGWGDGILVVNRSGAPYRGSLDLADTLIDRSALAGLELHEATTGAVRRSVIRRGAFSVVQDNCNLELEDNLFEQNTEDRVSYGAGMPPLAPPKLPPTPGGP